MKFVLENNFPFYDFQYELYRQKEYYDWFNRGKDKELQTEFIVCTEKQLHDVLPDADLKEWCPVGSVEFCVNWYKRVWGKTPLPKNVPDELMRWCKRKFAYMDNDIEHIIPSFGDNIFVKDTKTIKSVWNGIKNNRDDWWMYDGDHFPHLHFQVSQIIDDIEAEWRCFVYDGKLIDIKCYAGNPFKVPSKKYVEQCIKDYKSAPVAYTLDVCTRSNHTLPEVIEVHDFFSCGLYGFNDKVYPFMLWRWFKEFIKE